MGQIEKLKEIKATLEEMAEKEWNAPDRNNAVLDELEKAITHIRKTIVVINEELKAE
jgi:adenosyl cobinamide kinase/adenosyl cobinamide phosphate guanylyltransferase